MQILRVELIAGLLALNGLCILQIRAQDNSREKDPLPPEIVTGQAFSAIKYTRTVRVQPDGRRTVVAEGHHMLLAHDGAGHVYMAGANVDGIEDKCDLPSLGKLPLCDWWGPFLFEPEKRTMWHWTEGEFGDKTQLVQMDLRDDQMAEAEQLTSALQMPPRDSFEPGVNVQDLGERVFEGVRAEGVRTNTLHAGADGKPKFTIHEVWISEKMRLVLRVVDGDPKGEETVSGLNHISLTPDLSLFQPPRDRILRHSEKSYQYAGGDIRNLSQWFVK